MHFHETPSGLVAPTKGIQVEPLLVLPGGQEVRSTDPETITITHEEGAMLSQLVTLYRNTLENAGAWPAWRVALAVDAFTHLRMWDLLEALRDPLRETFAVAAGGGLIRLPVKMV